jgi:hypothetical protein
MNKPAQPIMWFLNDDHLLANKQSLAGYNYLPSLLIDRTHLLPFQIMRDDTGGGASPIPLNITSVKLYKRGAPVTKYVELILYLTFKRYTTITDGGIHKVNVYDGTSTIPAITQGIHYMVATDDQGHTWTSSEFVSSFPRFKLIFEYSNPKSIEYMVQPVTYKIQVESKTFSSGEVAELIEKYPDEDNNETVSFHKQDVIRSCSFLADEYTYEALKFMQMFKTIYLTEETGYRSQIEVYSIEATPIAESNHYGVVFKYSVPAEQVINVTETPFLLGDTQKGTSYVTPEGGVYVGRKYIMVGGKKVYL